MRRNRIAVVTMGVKLGYETKGYTRFLSVCQTLCNAGFDVDLITTSFQHWEKEQRDLRAFPYDMYDFGVAFIDEPGYKRNIDLKRLKSHAIAAQNLSTYFETGPRYDLIYCEIPPNDVALAAAKYAEAHSIPFVADINDLWPEAMRMVFDVPLISDFLYSGIAHDASEVYKRVSAVVGTSNEYAARPLTDCDNSIERITVYVGNDLDEFDAGVEKYSPEIEKFDGEFWVTYAGTLGKSYDIETMIKAVDLLNDNGYEDVKVMVLGDGPDAKRLVNLAQSLECNTEFLGYMPYPEMAAFLSKSDVLVNSLVKKAPQSIVTKIGDYLAAGHPMINTCSSNEFRSKVENDGFGINVEPEDPTLLAGAIASLYENPEACRQMGERARKISESQFDRKVSYLKIAELVDRTIMRH
ncbi:MAG: glycosyltransferase family 4 protein [Coriobacteriales bacterium]|jgi:glycosyltransferase involved in cell wall biosynthesis